MGLGKVPEVPTPGCFGFGCTRLQSPACTH
jgi:hypothetical protein